MTEPPRNDATIEAIQRDIALASTYRLEGIKASLTIATALLAFSVSFRPTLKHTDAGWLMLAAWLFLGGAILGGLLNLHGWDRFYISYRDYDWANDSAKGRSARKKIDRSRRYAATAQWFGLLLGVVCLAVFSWMNLPNVVSKGG